MYVFPFASFPVAVGSTIHRLQLRSRVRAEGTGLPVIGLTSGSALASRTAIFLFERTTRPAALRVSQSNDWSGMSRPGSTSGISGGPGRPGLAVGDGVGGGSAANRSIGWKMGPTEGLAVGSTVGAGEDVGVGDAQAMKVSVPAAVAPVVGVATSGVAGEAPAPWPPRTAALPMATTISTAAPAARTRRRDRRNTITDPL